MRIDKLKLLLSIEIKKYVNSNKSKNSFASIAMFFVGIFIFIYSITGTVFLYNYDKSLIPGVFGLISVVLIVFSVATTGYLSLFSEKEYNILFPLPLKDSEVITSKLIGLYISSLFYIFVILSFPICYMAIKSETPAFILIAIIMLLVFPAIPIVVSLLVTMFLSKHFTFKYKKQLGSVLGIVVVVIFYLLIYVFQKLFYNNLESVVLSIKSIFEVIYFPIIFFERAVLANNIFNALIFIVISGFIVIAAFVYIEKNYFTLYNRANIKSNSKKQTRETLKKHSLQSALQKKELKLFFSNSTYISNTIAMPITMIVIVIFSSFLGDESLNNLSGITNLTETINSYTLILLCMFSVMAQTAYCSMSIEGNNIWIPLSLPIKKEQIFLSKVRVGVSIMSVPLIIGAIVLTLHFKQGFILLIINIAVPINYSIFSNLVGLLYDLKTVNYNWTNSNEVVKQRFSMIVVMLVLIIPLLIIFVIKSKLLLDNVQLGIITFVSISIINYILWKLILKKDLYM